MFDYACVDRARTGVSSFALFDDRELIVVKTYFSYCVIVFVRIACFGIEFDALEANENIVENTFMWNTLEPLL